MGALRNSRTKSDVHIGVACAFCVLQSDQESAGGRRVVAVIHATPSVDVNGAVGRYGELARVTNLVRKDRRAESGRQTKLLVRISGAILFFAHNRSRAGKQIARETKPVSTMASKIGISCTTPLLPWKPELHLFMGTPITLKGRWGGPLFAASNR